MATYNSSSGKKYTMGKQLGAGGEGIVYEISGDATKVAKIYKDKKFENDTERSTMDRKLKAMIGMNIPVYVDGKLRLAWPLDILYRNGVMAGFVMPKINAACKIFDIQRADPTYGRRQPDIIKKKYPNYNWKYSVQYAYNLSWVVKYVHDNDIVIGDLNMNNIYADTSTGAVILIDCDSFDIKDPKSGEHFPCVVGLAEMLAPELQTVRNLRNGTFTEETDNFSLAIHIFRLLMRNADAFGGKITMSRSVSTIPANVSIINGECPYVRNDTGKTVPEWSPTLDMLPSSLQSLFKKTFEYNAVTGTTPRRISNRATASEWCNALAVLGAPEPNNTLQKCYVDQRHVYPKHSSYCPWCKCLNNKAPSSVVGPTIKTSQTNTITVPAPPASAPFINGTTWNQQSAASGGGLKQRRTPYLFYVILIAFGLASGFVFGSPVCQAVSSSFDVVIETNLCTIILSTVGVIGGALIAHHFEDRYIHANNAIPWLFLGIGALFVPLLVALALGIVAGIVMLAFAVIVAILEVIVGIICLIAILGGICSGS